MKKITTTIISLLLFTTAFGQGGRKFYEQGIEKAQAGKFEEAIYLFSKAINCNRKTIMHGTIGALLNQ